MKTVEIKGKRLKVKNTLRALFIFEQISGKAFVLESALDNFLFLYSVLLACNPDEQLGWEEFIDALDEDPGITENINKILNESGEIEQLLSGDKEEGEEVKKK